MNIISKQRSRWFYLLLLTVALMVTTPGGAVQIRQNSWVSPNVQSAAGQPVETLSSAAEGDRRILRRPQRCSALQPCNGKTQGRRINKKKAMLLAMMVGLSVKRR